jgi:hypothetical protein
MSSFPSGPWTGFYTYSGRARKFPMDLVLEFQQGIVSGEGHDGVGGFVIAGNYSVENQECAWQKTYVGRHTVAYTGFGEDKGIWGTWTLPGAKGGFQIWPLAEGAPVAALEKEAGAPVPVAAPQSIRVAD